MASKKKTYCKQHECFDTCAMDVSKALRRRDDGIRHLVSVEHVNGSTEDRDNGAPVAMETGRRKMDGTPNMGHGEEGSGKITDGHKMGRSGSRKPVGMSGIREVSKGLSGHDAFASDV